MIRSCGRQLLHPKPSGATCRHRMQPSAVIEPQPELVLPPMLLHTSQDSASDAISARPATHMVSQQLHPTHPSLPSQKTHLSCPVNVLLQVKQDALLPDGLGRARAAQDVCQEAAHTPSHINNAVKLPPGVGVNGCTTPDVVDSHHGQVECGCTLWVAECEVPHLLTSCVQLIRDGARVNALRQCTQTRLRGQREWREGQWQQTACPDNDDTHT